MASQWLLLAHQLPTRSSNARVKTWRRLQQIGAIPARNSVYVLPNTEQCREDLEWLRHEIVELGGEATVFAADVVDAEGAADLIEAFRRAREADYRDLNRAGGRIRSSARGRRAPTTSDRANLIRAIRHLRERLTEIERIDFFHAPGRDAAAATLATLGRLVDVSAPARTPVARARLKAADYANRRWVTRPRPGVDRMASAWLIRRFIDPNATFAFATTRSSSEIAFDTYEGEFSHQGPLCTFEVLTQRFGLVAPAVIQVGHIVHDLDMKDARYAAVEAPAIERMVQGLQQRYVDDHVLLEHGIGMFETLARSFESTDGRASPRPRRPSTGRKTRQPR